MGVKYIRSKIRTVGRDRDYPELFRVEIPLTTKPPQEWNRRFCNVVSEQMFKHTSMHPPELKEDKIVLTVPKRRALEHTKVVLDYMKMANRKSSEDPDPLDKLVDIVKERGRVSLDEASVLLEVDKNLVEKLARSLDKYGVVFLNYGLRETTVESMKPMRDIDEINTKLKSL